MKREDYKNIITKEVKATTKQADAMRYEADNYRYTYGDICEAYERPSFYKVRSFERIKERAKATEGYNYDLRITGRNSCTYTTIYTFTEGNTTYIVKDTKDNTYITIK